MILITSNPTVASTNWLMFGKGKQSFGVSMLISMKLMKFDVIPLLYLLRQDLRATLGIQPLRLILLKK